MNSNLATRVEFAHKTAKLGVVAQRNEKNKPVTVLIPGSEGARYKVFITRFPRSHSIRCQCMRVREPLDDICEGALYGICRHILTAMVKIAEDAKMKVSFCEKKEDAERLRKISRGTVTLLHSVYNHNELFMVTSEKGKRNVKS